MSLRSSFSVAIGSIAMALSLVCGGGGGGGGTSNPVPMFTSQPSNQTVYSGGNATFSVTVSGSPAPTVAWQRSNDNGNTWTTISGVSGLEYSFSSENSDNGAEFKALASNATGTTASNVATITIEPSIYLTGDLSAGSIGGYWRNGTWFSIPSCNMCYSIATTGSTTYAGGSINSSGNITPAYWINGSLTALIAPSGTINGYVKYITISGNDVYAAEENSGGNIPPGYWLNESWTPLPLPTGCVGGGVDFISVVNNNVYTIGSLRIVNGGSVAPAGYWLNQTWVPLPVPTSYSGGRANSITVSGNNVYVGGYCSLGSGQVVPGYWLNGSWVGLTTPPNFPYGACYAIFATNSNVYIAGTIYSDVNGIETNSVGYWQNGAWVELTTPAGTNPVNQFSFFVSGNNIYAATECEDNNDPLWVSGYWVNGVWASLPNMTNIQSISVY